MIITIEDFMKHTILGYLFTIGMNLLELCSQVNTLGFMRIKTISSKDPLEGRTGEIIEVGSPKITTPSPNWGGGLEGMKGWEHVWDKGHMAHTVHPENHNFVISGDV